MNGTLVGTVRGFSPWTLNTVNDVNDSAASAPEPSAVWWVRRLLGRIVERRQCTLEAMLCTSALDDVRAIWGVTVGGLVASSQLLESLGPVALVPALGPWDKLLVALLVSVPAHS